MTRYRITIGCLLLSTLATAVYGTLGYHYTANLSFLANGNGTAIHRGHAIVVANGDLMVGFEACRRTPY